MNKAQLIEYLLTVPHFADLNEERMDAVAHAFTVSTHPDGHVFFRQGAQADGVYLVLEGSVRVERDGVELNAMMERELVGLLALLDGQRRAATCSAVGETTVAWMPASAYQLLATRHEHISYPFQRALARQLAKDFRAASARVGETFAS